MDAIWVCRHACAGSAPSASLQGQLPAGFVARADSAAAAAPQGQGAQPATGPEAAAAAEAGSAAGRPLPQEKRPPKKAGGIRSELVRTSGCTAPGIYTNYHSALNFLLKTHLSEHLAQNHCSAACAYLHASELMPKKTCSQHSECCMVD